MQGGGPGVIFDLNPQVVAATIFVATYATIVTERVHRTIVVLLGAGFMIMSGVLDQSGAVAGVDFNTISLLTGMMILVGITEKTGLFQFVAVWVAKTAKAEPRGILVLLSTVTAVFSALFDNVSTVLLIVPVTLLITQKLELSPHPFLFAEILASNIGGTATLIGDPPNILIGSAAGLTFTDFALELGPVVIIIHLVVLAVILMAWGSKLKTSRDCRARIMAFEERDSITDARLLKQCLAVLALVILGFILVDTLHQESGSVALFGAAVLMLVYNFGNNAKKQSQAVEEILGGVEWSTLAFFVGLFAVVAGVEESGLLQLLGAELMSITGGEVQDTAFFVLWISAISSAIIDNIPFVATMIPLLQSTSAQLGGEQVMEPVWWALSLGACLGGNGSLVGASANLIVAGFAERAGHPVRFVAYLLIGLPIMLLTVAVASAYLYLRHFN